MLAVGFSTGALCRGALTEGVAAAAALGCPVIELSALRVSELSTLVDFVEHNSFSSFTYVSLHAPTDYSPAQEPEVAASLQRAVLSRRWNVVVHPDCIRDVELWKPFGNLLCIENMDKRKIVGRTSEELTEIFKTFPRATLCFDIAHAHQVDATMTEAYRILRDCGDRIRQIHVSEVTSSSRHDLISEGAVSAFRKVARLLPTDVPIILETPVTPAEAKAQVRQAERIFVSSDVAAQPA